MGRCTVVAAAAWLILSGPWVMREAAAQGSWDRQATTGLAAQAPAAKRIDPGSRAMRRCMRARFGPRYFAGVKRAHRYVMAQECGG